VVGCCEQVVGCCEQVVGCCEQVVGCCEHGQETLGSIKWEFLDWLRTC